MYSQSYKSNRLKLYADNGLQTARNFLQPTIADTSMVFLWHNEDTNSD